MEENEYIENNSKNTKHKSNFSLTENTKDKIKDKKNIIMDIQNLKKMKV